VIFLRRTLFLNSIFLISLVRGATKSFVMILVILMAVGLLVQQWKWNNYRTQNLRYRTKKKNDFEHFI
jgi:hypothetical protein